MTVNRTQQTIRLPDHAAASVFSYLAVCLGSLALISAAAWISTVTSKATPPAVFAALLAGHLCLAAHLLRVRYIGVMMVSLSLAALDICAMAARL
jgi:hypothetical protein